MWPYKMEKEGEEDVMVEEEEEQVGGRWRRINFDRNKWK